MHERTLERGLASYLLAAAKNLMPFIGAENLFSFRKEFFKTGGSAKKYVRYYPRNLVQIDSKHQKMSFECSPIDKQHIADLISTLDNASLMTLGLKAPRLISIGSTLSHIHPLLFIHVAMTDHDLRARIRRIFESSVKRIVFMNGNGIAEGFGHRLNRESSKKNLEPHLKDFAETLHVPVPFLVELVQKRAWNDLFVQLCEKIDGPSAQTYRE